MMLRICLCLLALTLLLRGGDSLAQNTIVAQNKVRTETIKPPAVGNPPPGGAFMTEGHVIAPAAGAAANPEILTDPARLPDAVARMRDRILTAARTGDPAKVVAVMQSNATMPVFSFSDDKDPAGFWKKNYPDSDGIEVLSILVTVLEAGFVHVDVGTPQELYLWPYFARTSLATLTPAQKVELFRIVTGADYKDMVEFGAYSFYRVGISPDGTWRFFVSGD